MFNIIVFLIIILSAYFSSCTYSQAANLEEQDVAKLYHQYCSVCHGDKGDGLSRAMANLVPPPRDFTTPHSTMELTRERMIHSITEGRSGTAMTPWKSQLTDSQIEALADFIRVRFMVPTAYETSNEGRRIYAEYCSVCHGDKGDGMSRATLSLNPPPSNFTSKKFQNDMPRKRMVFSITYGRSNTAMAPWGNQLKIEQINSVVDYIRSTFMDANNYLDAEHPTKQPANISNPNNVKQNASDQLLETYFSEPYPFGLSGNVDIGKALYFANCVVCHGKKGNGRGPRAYFIFPKPRDFGQSAARAKLNRPHMFEAIAKGVLRSEMPAWEKVLSSQQIAHISEYVIEAYILR